VSFLPLSVLLTHGRAAGSPLALSRGSPVGFGRFAADVACATDRLRVARCRRAALLCRNRYRFAVGLFGLLHAGSTVVLPPNGQPGTLSDLADEFDMLIDDGFIESLAGEAAMVPPIDPRCAYVEFFTSGSSGTPKRVKKSLAALEREVATLDRIWGGEIGRAATVATVSHQHLYGFTFTLLWPLAAGRPITCETHEIWEELFARLTLAPVIVTSPAHLGRLSGIAPVALALRPRAIFSAGAPLSFTAARDACTVFGMRPTEIFGTTETGVIATRRRTSEHQPWQALPGIEVGADPTGRLSVLSPFVDGNEWVETGDLIEPVDGGFHARGRADRLVKIEGKRISLLEIEHALCRLPWAEDAVALALPGDPPRLAAVVVPSELGRARLNELGRFRFGRLLRRALTATQESSGLPRLWRFCDQLPGNHMGKRREAEILALFGITP
jgi:acyl-coenzyme A synthetase/AMP-(fatty) acid ligase